MAQLNLGQVVPNIEITETSDGKNIKLLAFACGTNDWSSSAVRLMRDGTQLHRTLIGLQE